MEYKPLFEYRRIKNIQVRVGNTYLGNEHRIKIQTMTNTATQDIDATVNQCIRILEAGADYVRIAVASIKDVENFSEIKNQLKKFGYNQPLIADIHFNPLIAYEAAKVADKIRINPGNFVNFQKKKYNDNTYEEERSKIVEKLLPLIEICKNHNTTIRIGVNHGSLPLRIIEKYGDTPDGMVVTAMEYIQIFRKYQFNQLIISMKSSNPMIMIYANRLLIDKMSEEGIIFPIHIGVTEAGEGEDGRIKSAIGIGALLLDGIGDTVRVSLTEDPENEIPVAKKIVKYIEEKNKYTKPVIPESFIHNPYRYSKFESQEILNIGGNNTLNVFLEINSNIANSSNIFIDAGWFYDSFTKRWAYMENSADILFLNDISHFNNIDPERNIIVPFKNWENSNKKNIYPLLKIDEFLNFENDITLFVEFSYKDFNQKLIEKIKKFKKSVLIITDDNYTDIYGQRVIIYELANKGIKNPIILKRNYNNVDSYEDLQIKSSVDFSIFLIDGYLDGIWITSHNFSSQQILNTSFNILQATRRRIFKTEYISCPSCGRTNFNIIETLKKIKERTHHLKGLKIAVMGCIVNGPGEMADADYGYVGAGIGKINLYKGKNLIKKNIQEKNAVKELINLIKENGDWIEQ